MPPLNEILAELFRAHNVPCTVAGDAVTFAGRLETATAEIVRELPPRPSVVSLQIDVRFNTATGAVIVESFAGIGATRERAVADAVQNFVLNSFHVLLAAFFAPDDPHVSRETWRIGTSDCRVTIGNATARGSVPAEDAGAWFDTFATAIKARRLVPGMHWARLYYAQDGGRTTVCEVLLDNSDWESVQEEMQGFAWTPAAAFYSLRVFLVIEVGVGDPDSPENTVLRLAEILAVCPIADEDVIYEAMANAGIDAATADRAYKFTQTAWGQLLLRAADVTFPPDYIYFDAEGNVAERGLLRDEPFFNAASQIAAWYARTPAFQPSFLGLAMRSAAFNAVKLAADAGGKLSEMEMGAAFLFLSTPTEAGATRARKTMDEYMAAIPRRAPVAVPEPVSPPVSPPAAPTKKPWWQFGRGGTNGWQRRNRRLARRVKV